MHVCTCTHAHPSPLVPCARMHLCPKRSENESKRSHERSTIMSTIRACPLAVSIAYLAVVSSPSHPHPHPFTLTVSLSPSSCGLAYLAVVQMLM